MLDTGGFGPADPSLDLLAVWHLFDRQRRELFAATLGCSDLEWERGAAWGFEQAIGAYWYYQHTNPSMAEMGRTTLERFTAEYVTSTTSHRVKHPGTAHPTTTAGSNARSGAAPA